MDIPQLCGVLQGALSSEENQRKAAEALLQQVGTAACATVPPLCAAAHSVSTQRILASKQLMWALFLLCTA